MTSSVRETNHDGELDENKLNKTVTTIHRIYRGDEEITIRDPNNRRSFINRPAYVKLHRSFSSGSKRHSVDNLKGRFENLARQNSQEKNQSENKNTEVPTEIKKEEPSTTKEDEIKFTPASFGYPKTAKLTPPLIKPKPALLKKRTPKDENSNVVNQNSESNDVEEVRIVVQPSASEESVDKIAKELSNFTMDTKIKDKKRSGNLRKWLGLFGKDKKKKDEEKNKQKAADNVYTDNMKNESSFNRQSSHRQTVPIQNVSDQKEVAQRVARVLPENVDGEIPQPTTVPNQINRQNEIRRQQEAHEERLRELEREYARIHMDRFNQLRQNFGEERDDNYVVMMDNNKTKPVVNDCITAHVNKYIDTSSSTSSDSEKQNEAVPRETPPRAQETHQEIKVVKPKASIPISTERSTPNLYRNEKASPRTIERNLNKSISKDYPDKGNVTQKEEVNYGSVFDSYTKVQNGDMKPMNSPRLPLSPHKPLSLECTKLKLPPNREIYEPQPRVKSPIPTNRVSTEKIIATELLKNTTRSPTPPKRSIPKPLEEFVIAKPPMSPKSSKKEEPQSDRIVTNALIHEPTRRAQTPLEHRTYMNVTPNIRTSTPVDLRMSVSMKMSPQKQDIRKSIEEYYWKELKKLKEEEDSRLYSLQVNGYYDDPARVRRSRSLSPSSHRAGRRSLSLPRENKGLSYVDYPRVPPPQSIPEDKALTTDGLNGGYFVYDQNFIRNNPERRSVDSLQRPIFRRGSLTKQEVYETTPYNKKVSFSNPQATQAWPARNGYTQNPPQRRLDRINSELEDEVFSQSPVEPVYGTRYTIRNEPVYSNRILEQFRAQQYDNMRRQRHNGPTVDQMDARRLSMDSLPHQQDIYVTRNQSARRPLSNVPLDDYGSTNFQRYPSNSQLSQQHNPVYSSRQSITDSNYGQKNVTMRNKYCDIYGQIHDSPQSGVVMGQLKNTQMVVPRQPDNFTRGSRLTASANDIGKRYVDPRYYESNYNEKISTNYDNRPLPPLPRKSGRNSQISDTESGSDASEIQRIMQNKTKNKKRGFFGK